MSAFQVVTMPTTRILLCSDDPARRRLYGAAIGTAADLALVGIAAADESAVRAAAAGQPDVVVVESVRPGLDGAKLVGRLRTVAPRVAVLAVAAAADRPRTVIARSLAADRYVDPDVAAAGLLSELLDFVREHRGGAVAS